MPAKDRLDNILVNRSLVTDRDLGQRMIMAGQVRVKGQVVLQPSIMVVSDAEIEIDLGPRYVSRGGEKLDAALQTFGVSPAGRICADVGASTGGFTDCLLQNGAKRVFAIDVGQGILDWKLRQDPRVVVMEQTNARSLAELPEKVSLVTIDASFISLKVLLPVVAGWFSSQSGSHVIALIKPQFEAQREIVERGKGVIRDAHAHRRVLEDVLGYAIETDWLVLGLIASPLLGPKGNREFLAWLEHRTEGQKKNNLAEISAFIEQIFAKSENPAARIDEN